jgi:conjugative relaxase-like TrwC/TraI family protein
MVVAGEVLDVELAGGDRVQESGKLVASRLASEQIVQLDQDRGRHDPPLGARSEQRGAPLVVLVVGVDSGDERSGVEDQRNGCGSNSSRLARSERSPRPEWKAPISENGGCGPVPLPSAARRARSACSSVQPGASASTRSLAVMAERVASVSADSRNGPTSASTYAGGPVGESPPLPEAQGAGYTTCIKMRSPGGRPAVLTIGKLGASVDQLAYYEQQVAQGLEDYLSGRGEAPGRWIGGGCGGCGGIGLRGEVDRTGFMRAMRGCDPRSGEALRPPRSRTKVAAFDLSFSAPKSVSVLFAIADEETSGALLEAHERAVEAAFAYVEREACFTRRGHNGERRIRGDGFVAAAYRHRLSRAGDPQLHTHVVVANMTRAEGRWTTLEAHSLYEHKSAAGAVYRAVLRAGVRERLPWMWWRQVGRGLFEIEDLPNDVLRQFSRRRVEIEERAFELTGVAASQLSRERLQGIALATRKAKECGVDGARWRREARARAAEHGLGQREVEGLIASAPRLLSVAEAEVVRRAGERLSGPGGLTENHNTFARRHALAELAGEFAQGADVTQLERATSSYLDHRSVVTLGRVAGERRFTTRDLMACEETIVTGAVRRASERTAMLHPRVPDLMLADQDVRLSHEQLQAVRELTTDGQGVSVLQALAGTGKTRLLAAVAHVYAGAGYRVIGVAPTARRSRAGARRRSPRLHDPAAAV